VSAIGERIDSICGYRNRLAGTDAERRLTNELGADLETDGWRVAIEPTWVHPQWALAHLLHCLVAIAGSVVAPSAPVIGFALVLVAATSAYLDLSGRFHLLRRLLFRRASQNLLARRPATGEGSDRVILCANVDAPRTGAVYNPGPMRLLDAAARRLPVASAPTRIWFWSLALLLLPIGARMAGLDAAWLDYVQLVPTLVLIVACFALGEIALSPASPGANANASGVAAALATARLLDAEPPRHLRVELLLIGGGETTMEGMRAFLRAHRKDLERERTRFVSFESVGRGEPRYAVSGGLAVSAPFDRELIEACAAIAAAREGGEGRAEPFRDARATAATVARAHRRRAIAITCSEPGRTLPAGHHTPGDLPSTVDPDAVEAASRLAVDAVRLVDRGLGRAAAGTSADRGKLRRSARRAVNPAS
jgi:hypothetical protein